MPITDARPPDARFEAIWSAHGPAVLDVVRVGGRILVHCRGGLGRAGTVAARILIELGHPGAEAVELVRRARPGAIETRDQLCCVMGLRSPGTADPSGTGHSSQGGEADGLV